MLGVAEGAAGKGSMARSVRSVGRSLGAGLLVLVVVSGCDASGDPEVTASPSASSASPSASPSPSPSPSASSSAPEVPAAARAQTPAGAEAFVKFFFEQFNVAWTKPQAGLIEGLSDPECKFCGEVESTASRLARDAQRYSTDPVELFSRKPFGGAPEGQQFVDVGLVQNRADVVDASGNVVKTDPRSEDHFYVTLRWREGSWSLLELERTG